LANEWIRARVNLTIITDVPVDPKLPKEFSFRVYNRPSPWRFFQLVRENDVFIHFNVSLRALWPLLFLRRPFIAVHHGFYVTDESNRRDWREKLKLFVAKRATENIAVSEAIARTIGIDCKIIVNPFEADAYQDSDYPERNKDLVFLGRLVSSKGAQVLIEALEVLRRSALELNLTIIGDGPEREPLENLVRILGLKQQITFTGTIPTERVAKLLREHKVLVVPSIWNEGFGVVALEGIASGCVVVASDSGGLPEAVGDCGIVVRAGDPQELADGIKRILTEPGLINALKINSVDHLACHAPERIAQRYLTVITEAISE